MSTKAHTEALVDTEMHAQRAHLDFTFEEFRQLLTGILRMVQILELLGAVLSWSPHQVENSEYNLVRSMRACNSECARARVSKVEGGVVSECRVEGGCGAGT